MKVRELLTVLVLIFCLLNQFASTAFAASGPVKIIAFGDSITAGMARTPDNVRYCTHDGTSGFLRECEANGVVNRGGYAPYLANGINAMGYSTTVYNWGTSGELTYEMLNRIDAVMNATPSDYIAIMGGANDAIRNFSANFVAFNYKEMLKKALAAGVYPLIGTVTPNLNSSRLLGFTNIYSDEIRIIAASLECEASLADQNAWLANFSAYDSGDLLHANDAGNRRMAEQWVMSFVNRKNCVNITPIISLLLDD